MKKAVWQYTIFPFITQLLVFLNDWDALIGGPNLKLIMNDGCVVAFYKYHRAINPNERPTAEELQEAT